jgi:hypothetical protein
MFARPLINDASGLTRIARQGDGCFSQLNPSALSADANTTIAVSDLAGGLILRSGLTAGRTDTSPTAALLTAAFTNMDVGDSFEVTISNQSGFTETLAGGVGVTASGNLLVLTLTAKRVLFIKDSAAAWRMIAL